MAAGAEEGKKVSEGVEYLRAVGEEAGLSTEEQDSVLLDMAGEARECAERPTETEEEVALAQEGESEGPSEDEGEDKPEKKGKGKKDKKPEMSSEGEESEGEGDDSLEDSAESVALA